MRTAIAFAAVALLAALLPACGSSPQGAWEGRVDMPQGSDPTGYEVHVTLTRFMSDETSGAVEYTVFHPNSRLEACSTNLIARSKSGGVFEFEEEITKGPCEDGLTVRVSAAPNDKLKWEKLKADGSVDWSGTLDVQTGLETAKSGRH